jgi:hypothetical protein
MIDAAPVAAEAQNSVCGACRVRFRKCKRAEQKVGYCPNPPKRPLQAFLPFDAARESAQLRTAAQLRTSPNSSARRCTAPRRGGGGLARCGVLSLLHLARPAVPRVPCASQVHSRLFAGPGPGADAARSLQRALLLFSSSWPARLLMCRGTFVPACAVCAPLSLSLSLKFRELALSFFHDAGRQSPLRLGEAVRRGCRCVCLQHL